MNKHPPIQTVFITPNPTHEAPWRAVPRVVRACLELGFRVLLEKGAPPFDPIDGVVYLDRRSAVKQCDLILPVGGDGTVLRRCAEAAAENKPLLGINQGTVGFLTELEITDLPLLAKLRTGDYDVDKRMMLEARLVAQDGSCRFQGLALNDVVLQRSAFNTTIPVSVYMDEAHVISFRGDGALVCTPTGSSAYSLAAGGPLLEPTCDCLAVTPICPHSLGIKSFVVPGQRVLTLDPAGYRVPVRISVDGFLDCDMIPGERVVVRRSEHSICLIRLSGTGFYERIAKKLC